MRRFHKINWIALDGRLEMDKIYHNGQTVDYGYFSDLYARMHAKYLNTASLWGALPMGDIDYPGEFANIFGKKRRNYLRHAAN